ncbi:MAG: hypothetical protein LH619_08035 [Chitinophagaceae bacterium]|nr:hypothetical protein [Chitinophagaceae bacterium]
MEVHAHTHTPRKKWTHYFWEFLMLFLAVFCGFLAEYQLEHKIERDREKQFIQSLVNDLEMDSARLQQIIRLRNEREIILDSLINLIKLPNRATQSRYIYHYNSFATRMTFQFYPNDGTIQQLKNAGNLRLIRKHNVRDSLSSYDVASRFLVSNGNVEEMTFEAYRTVAQEIFDGSILEKTRLESNDVIRLDYDPPLHNKDDAIFKLMYRIHMLKNFIRGMRNLNRQSLEKANNLLALLKEEYHLK